MTKTALIVGAGSGISAAFARALGARRLQDCAVGPQHRQARRARQGDRRGCDRRRCDQARCRQGAVRRGRPYARGARRRSVQRQLPHARAVPRSRSRRGREDACRVVVRRVSGRPGGGQAHGGRRRGRHLLHRRLGQREGLCAVRAVRHGQVRPARPRAIDGARAGARRTSTSRTSSSTAASGAPSAAASRRPALRRTASSIPTPSRRPTWPCSSSRAAPGASRSSCGRGWSGSEPRTYDPMSDRCWCAAQICPPPKYAVVPQRSARVGNVFCPV